MVHWRVIREGQCLSVLIPMAGRVGNCAAKSSQVWSVKPLDLAVFLGVIGRCEDTINTEMGLDDLEERRCKRFPVLGQEARWRPVWKTHGRQIP